MRTTPFDQYFLDFKVRTTPFEQYFLGEWPKITKSALNSRCTCPEGLSQHRIWRFLLWLSSRVHPQHFFNPMEHKLLFLAPNSIFSLPDWAAFSSGVKKTNKIKVFKPKSILIKVCPFLIIFSLHARLLITNSKKVSGALACKVVFHPAVAGKHVVCLQESLILLWLWLGLEFMRLLGTALDGW